MGSKAVERSCLVTAKARTWEKYMSDHPLPQEYWDKRSPRDGIEVITDRYWERRS